MIRSQEFFDATVIGGGPAGSIAASKLSSHGYKVILFEKANPPRYKTCGGGIVKRVAELLDPEIRSEFENEFYSVEVFDHQAGFHHFVTRNYPLVYMSMRENFDNALLKKAESSGTKILRNCEVQNVSINNESVLIETTKGNYSAGFLIAADGAQGISTKKSGLRIHKKNLPAIEYEVSVSKTDMEKFPTARFDFGIVPGGYAWVFPKRNHLSIGLGIFATNNRTEKLNKYFNDYILKLKLNKIENIEKHGFYIPVSLSKNKLSTNRIFLAGDAAALADPLTAEGISSAIFSGQFAAEAIIEGEGDVEKSSYLYNQKIEENLWKELKGSLFLNKVFYSYDNIRAFLMKTYGIKLSEIIADIISGERKYSNLLKNPANYFKLVKHYFSHSHQDIFYPEHI
jgi:geranylgeranyl reductase family protein